MSTYSMDMARGCVLSPYIIPAHCCYSVGFQISNQSSRHMPVGPSLPRAAHGTSCTDSRIFNLVSMPSTTCPTYVTAIGRVLGTWFCLQCGPIVCQPIHKNHELNDVCGNQFQGYGDGHPWHRICRKDERGYLLRYMVKFHSFSLCFSNWVDFF